MKCLSFSLCVCVCFQEAMWNEDQVETKCSLLENDVEDLTEEVREFAVCLCTMGGGVCTYEPSRVIT